MTREEIIRTALDKDVSFIRLQFTDLCGTLKNVAITTSRLKDALNDGVGLDGSIFEGFGCLGTDSLVLRPDPETFAFLPWRPQQGRVCRIICDVDLPGGGTFEGDSRQILKRVVKKAREMGYELRVKPDLAFYLFHMGEDGRATTRISDEGGYLDIAPIDQGENARRDMILAMEEMGLEIESSRHERGKGQHAVVISDGDPLLTADKITTFKQVARTISRRHGLHATFMPKPISDGYASGMSLGFSLKKDGADVFFENGGLSAAGAAFKAGIAGHIGAISALANPLVNSYKRLAYENSRELVTHLRHLPDARIEVAAPDPSANPYLAIAAITLCGLWGMENAVKESGVSVPRDLYEALVAFKEDELLGQMMDDKARENYFSVKKAEWDDYAKQVHSWEIDSYLARQ